eukprot:g568.t1
MSAKSKDKKGEKSSTVEKSLKDVLKDTTVGEAMRYLLDKEHEKLDAMRRELDRALAKIADASEEREAAIQRGNDLELKSETKRNEEKSAFEALLSKCGENVRILESTVAELQAEDKTCRTTHEEDEACASNLDMLKTENLRATERIEELESFGILFWIVVLVASAIAIYALYKVRSMEGTQDEGGAATIKHLKVKIKDSETARKRAQKSAEEAKQKLKEAVAKQKRTDGELEHSRKSAEEAKRKLVEAAAKQKRIAGDLEHSRKSAEEAKRKLVEAAAKQKRIAGDLERSRKSAEEAKTTLKQTTRELKRVKNESSELRNKVKRIESRVADSRDMAEEVEKLTMELDSMRDAAKSLESKKKQLMTLQGEVLDLNEKMKETKRKESGLKSKLRDLERRSNESTEELRRRKVEIESKQRKIERMETEMADLEKQIEEAENDLVTLRKTSMDSKLATTKAEDRCAQFQDELARARKNIGQTTERLRKSEEREKSANEDYETIRSKLEALRKSLESKSDDTIEQMREQFESDLASATKAKDKIIHEIRGNLERTQSKHKKDMDSLAAEARKLDTKVIELEKDLSRSGVSLESERSRCQRLEEQLSELKESKTKERREREARNIDHSTKMQRLQRSVVEKDAEIGRLADALDVARSDARREKQDMQLELRTAKEASAAKSKALQERIGKMKSANDLISKREHEKSESAASLSAKLEERELEVDTLRKRCEEEKDEIDTSQRDLREARDEIARLKRAMMSDRDEATAQMRQQKHVAMEQLAKCMAEQKQALLSQRESESELLQRQKIGMMALREARLEEQKKRAALAAELERIETKWHRAQEDLHAARNEHGDYDRELKLTKEKLAALSTETARFEGDLATQSDQLSSGKRRNEQLRDALGKATEVESHRAAEMLELQRALESTKLERLEAENRLQQKLDAELRRSDTLKTALIEAHRKVSTLEVSEKSLRSQLEVRTKRKASLDRVKKSSANTMTPPARFEVVRTASPSKPPGLPESDEIAKVREYLRRRIESESLEDGSTPSAVPAFVRRHSTSRGTRQRLNSLHPTVALTRPEEALLWAVFHSYSVRGAGQAMKGMHMSMTQFQSFCTHAFKGRSGARAKRSKAYRHPGRENVNLLFIKACSAYDKIRQSKPSRFVTRSGNKKKSLEFEEFFEALLQLVPLTRKVRRGVERTRKSPGTRTRRPSLPATLLEVLELLRDVILPLANELGSQHTSIGSPGQKVREVRDDFVADDKEFAKERVRRFVSSDMDQLLSKIFSIYEKRGQGWDFEAVRDFANDFGLTKGAKHICSLRELEELFSMVNLQSSVHDDVVDFMSYEEFLAFFAHMGLKYGSPELTSEQRILQFLRWLYRHVKEEIKVTLPAYTERFIDRKSRELRKKTDTHSTPRRQRRLTPKRTPRSRRK